MTWKERYREAHYKNELREHPNVVKDGHYTPPKYPDVTTSGGLSTAITNFVDWIGGLGNRISVTGRKIGGMVKTESGAMFNDEKWISGRTKTGTADTDLQIPHPAHYFGIHVYAEIKIGKDTQKKAQYRFMNKADGSTGVYVLIKNIDQWFTFYNDLMAFAYKVVSSHPQRTMQL